MKSKDEIRREMRRARRQVDAKDRVKASEALCRKLLARWDVQRALELRQPFAAYLASGSELDLAPLVKALWAADVTVAVPCWNAEGGRYVLAAYDNTTTLVQGSHHVAEPADACEIAAEDIGLWIVPGLAFTPSGARLGYGGGWYDRMLARAAPGAVKIGVCYPFQMVADLPVEDHDRPLTCVVTAEEE
ncbi:MAG: 5-formyltetrahydrofolate cyclo-ligase [Kiritimatiellia bacterium]